MARANVPKFGNWENEDNVPYTVYFDKARKNKGGKMINPNDPQENPEVFTAMDPSHPAPAPAPTPTPAPAPAKPRAGPEEPIRKEDVRPAPEHRISREEADFRQFSNSPARSANESSYGGRGQRPGRAARPSAGSEQSFERSPLHPHYQAKVMARGSASPSWEGRNNENSHGTPGRSRLKPTTRGGDESPDKGAAVPRFGAWDENDPQSAENFTHIFNKVREERNVGTGNPSGTPKHPAYAPRNQQNTEHKRCCCGWW